MKSEISRRRALGTVAGAALAPSLLAQPARPQTLAQTMRGALDANEAGLRPGAVDDQSAAFETALATAEAAGRPLFLAPGRYNIGRIILPPHAQLVGVPGQSELVFSGGPFMLRGRGLATLRLHGVTLRGRGIRLDPAVPGLLDVDDVAEIVIDDCTFTDSGAAGIAIANGAGRVERSRFTAHRTVGIYLRESNAMAVTDNVVTGCGDTGILVARYSESADNTIVSGNRVSAIAARSGGSGQNGNGINLDKANGVIVTNNRVDDCAFSAIRCFSSDSLVITNNIATRSREMALYVEFAFEGAIVANNLIDGGNGGISFANFMEHGGRLGVCSGNIIRNITGGPTYPDGNRQIGAGIAAEADIAVTGNVVEDTIWGLMVGWGPYLRDVTASANVIRRTKIGIAVSVVDGAGPAVIADNIISDAEQAAILGMRWMEPATGDLANSPRELPGITVEGNRVG